ncbi:LOW QUALITY PROTEIN: Lipase_GDSL domain-containing protein, partial [Cephalotus follicularis]
LTMKVLVLFSFYLSLGSFYGSVLTSSRHYESIFNFGDSLSDTGNFLLSGALAFPVIAKLPYPAYYHAAMPFFHSPKRYEADYEGVRLPLEDPVVVTLLVELFTMKRILIDSGSSADILYKHAFDQLRIPADQLKPIKTPLVGFAECDNYFKKSPFIVGEIGGNDYNYPFFVGESIKQLRNSVPLTKATSSLIEEGAVELLVPGNLPIGCLCVYLTLFKSPNKSDYDQRNGCLKAHNGFSKYLDNQLKKGLETLRQKYPRANIIYADYCHADMPFFHSPKRYGFYSGTLRACYGGGPYNFNNSARCGHIGSKACQNPSSYANWDGIHLTEAAYRVIAMGLVKSPYASPPLK